MRNAGIPRRRASSNRQARRSSSRRDPDAAGARSIFGAVGSLTAFPGLRFGEVGVFFLRFRLVAGAEVSFMMNSMGVVLSATRPARVSLTVRYGICLPAFSKTASLGFRQEDKELGYSVRTRERTGFLGCTSRLKIVGDDAADFEVLQTGVSDCQTAYRIPIGSRCTADSFLRAFCWTRVLMVTDSEIQIVGGILDTFSGGLRIVTKELADAFTIHLNTPIRADALTLAGTSVPRQLVLSPGGAGIFAVLPSNRITTLTSPRPASECGSGPISAVQPAAW
jgi:hypothetical protein